MSLQKTLSLVLCLATFGLVSCAGERPSNLGVHDGQLAPCPASPNCVSTQAEDPEHSIEPIPFQGAPEEAQARLREVLQNMARTRIITDEPGYIHAESWSRIFRFVDDVEFLIDGKAGLIHFRSASRLGYGDMGVNRKRMEEIRARFLASD